MGTSVLRPNGDTSAWHTPVHLAIHAANRQGDDGSSRMIAHERSSSPTINIPDCLPGDGSSDGSLAVSTGNPPPMQQPVYFGDESALAAKVGPFYSNPSPPTGPMSDAQNQAMWWWYMFYSNLYNSGGPTSGCEQFNPSLYQQQAACYHNMVQQAYKGPGPVHQDHAQGFVDPGYAPSSPQDGRDAGLLCNEPGVSVFEPRKRARSLVPNLNDPSKKHCRRASREVKVCSNCQTTATPFWRKDKNGGGPLCNACGLYFAKNEAPRPKLLWKRGG